MYSKKNSEWLRHLDFEILDLICLELSMVLVNRLRNMSALRFGNWYSNLYSYIAFTYLIVMIFTHPHRDIIQRGLWKEAISVIQEASFCYALVILEYYFMHSSRTLPRLSVGMAWVGSVVILWLVHVIWKHHIRLSLLKSRNGIELVVVSNAAHILDALENITSKKYTMYNVHAVILIPGAALDARDVLKYTNFKDVPIILGFENGVEYLRKEVVDEVYVDSIFEKKVNNEMVENFLSMGLVVHMALEDIQSIYPHVSLGTLGSNYVATTRINDAYEWELTVKRIIDILAGIVGLFITGIAALFIVPAIKITDPGPALFVQERIGKNGRRFKFYKFRTMYMDAEERKAALMDKNEMKGFMFKMENDPRIIGSEKGPHKGLGNFLRSTSLDELPQFWNILIGDMSLIGTRPPTVGEYQQYEPRHKIRLSMKPGLTGLWQISGRSDITDFEEVVKLDTSYIVKWSLGLDIKILLKTFVVVFGKKGSR